LNAENSIGGLFAASKNFVEKAGWARRNKRRGAGIRPRMAMMAGFPAIVCWQTVVPTGLA